MKVNKINCKTLLFNCILRNLSLTFPVRNLLRPRNSLSAFHSFAHPYTHMNEHTFNGELVKWKMVYVIDITDECCILCYVLENFKRDNTCEGHSSKLLIIFLSYNVHSFQQMFSILLFYHVLCCTKKRETHYALNVNCLVIT